MISKSTINDPCCMEKQYCIPASPRLPVNVLMLPGKAFPTRELKPARAIHFPTSGCTPAFIAATPMRRLEMDKIIAGMTYGRRNPVRHNQTSLDHAPKHQKEAYPRLSTYYSGAFGKFDTVHYSLKVRSSGSVAYVSKLNCSTNLA